MRVLLWLLRAIVFIALFGLAIKNSAPVELRFFLDGVWQAPLSLVILAALATGVVLGLTVTVVRSAGDRRQLRALRERVNAGADERP
jgi:uncharacterized integral membrane protein